MNDALQNYIDGKWVDAVDGARFDVFNPATGEVIAQIVVSGFYIVHGCFPLVFERFGQFRLHTWSPAADCVG